MTTDYTTVTEIGGDQVTKEQIVRIANRYYWAIQFCHGLDVVEIACGTGQGLGLLSSVSKSVIGGDISKKLLEIAKLHYGPRMQLIELDAQNLPLDNESLDVLILFEAIYYLPKPDAFIKEAKRVLRKGGQILICTANKDLFDFNPSPFTHYYFGTVELFNMLSIDGFEVELFGGFPIENASLRQRILRPIKAIASKLNLIPKTMSGKKLLKRLVFGSLVEMPSEIDESTAETIAAVPITNDKADTTHKVIYCRAIKS